MTLVCPKPCVSPFPCLIATEACYTGDNGGSNGKEDDGSYEYKELVLHRGYITAINKRISIYIYTYPNEQVT